MRSALIVHPHKPYVHGMPNALSAEMSALANLLLMHTKITNVAFLCQDADNLQIHQYDEVWLMAFGKPGQGRYKYANGLIAKSLFAQLRDFDGRICYVANDPSYFGILESALPARLFSKRIEVAYCGEDWKEAVNTVPMPKQNHWLPLKNWFQLPLWQMQFGKNMLAPCQWPYEQLLYIGTDRSQYRSSLLKEHSDKVAWVQNLNSTTVANLQNSFFGAYVLGDAWYKALGTSPHRLLQAIHSGTLPVIDKATINCWFADTAISIEQALSLQVNERIRLISKLQEEQKQICKQMIQQFQSKNT